MLLPRFGYHEPRSLGEALEIMAHFGDKARILAGGTDLLVNLKKGLAGPREIVSLHRLKGAMTGIGKSRDGFKIGPLATAAQVAAADATLGGARVVAAAAGKLGSPLIRNRATAGAYPIYRVVAGQHAPSRRTQASCRADS